MGSERTCVSPSLGETLVGAEQGGCIPDQGELPPLLVVMTCVTLLLTVKATRILLRGSCPE